MVNKMSKLAQFLMQGLRFRDMAANNHLYEAIAIETENIRRAAAKLIAGDYIGW
jgi:hypothetical protein